MIYERDPEDRQTEQTRRVTKIKLTEAIHNSMCEVSDHTVPGCKNTRHFEFVADSVWEALK